MNVSGDIDDVTHAVREAVPRVLTTLMRRGHAFADAEDAVAEAVLAALSDWRTAGVPENPAGWLFRVAWRRRCDLLASDEARRRREQHAAKVESIDAAPPVIDVEDELSMDDTLILLFMCCHSSLTEPSAIALTLRAVGGLTTAEIASAFMVPEATMAQRISRAKETVRASGLPFAAPPSEERAARIRTVRHVLYLMFNEGHTASAGDSLVRVDLSTEAIRLARLFLRVTPDDAESAGLLALMLLGDARRPARTGPSGELIPLEAQDRSLWNRSAITEGTALIDGAFARGAVGPFQIQAAIAALHDAAPSVAGTDWRQILSLYGILEKMTQNPMVALNRAIALAMVDGPRAGLALIAEIADDPPLRGHYRVDAVRAHLSEMTGDNAAAIAHFEAAAKKTENAAERAYLERKAEDLRSRSRGIKE